MVNTTLTIKSRKEREKLKKLKQIKDNVQRIENIVSFINSSVINNTFDSKQVNYDFDKGNHKFDKDVNDENIIKLKFAKKELLDLLRFNKNLLDELNKN